MPCFISLSVEYQSSFTAAETEAQIQSVLINYINTYDSDILYVSKIVDQLHSIDIVSITLPLVITGTFYLPDGNIQVEESEDSIKIEDNFALGLSKKTYRFYIIPSDITMIKVEST